MGNFRASGTHGKGRFSGDRGNRGSFGGGRGGSRGGFRGGRGGGRFGGDRGNRGSFGGERRSLEMHNATCSKCAKACQVPFKPTGNKPVLCSDCFRNSGERGNARDSRGNANPGISAEQFSKINGKLDKIIKILEELEVVPAEGDEDFDEDEEDLEDEDTKEYSDENSGNLINDSK
jgi:CxxC-x17-CxxC domain-containing protein